MLYVVLINTSIIVTGTIQFNQLHCHRKQTVFNSQIQILKMEHW